MLLEINNILYLVQEYKALFIDPNNFFFLLLKTFVFQFFEEMTSPNLPISLSGNLDLSICLPKWDNTKLSKAFFF